ncbi:MAG: hypothetical protein LBU45_07620 [Azoarcus sp.]|jgi:hypothetical protein|nr:hypothetical protein [Azoarcus sp.]
MGQVSLRGMFSLSQHAALAHRSQAASLVRLNDQLTQYARVFILPGQHVELR